MSASKAFVFIAAFGVPALFLSWLLHASIPLAIFIAFNLMIFFILALDMLVTPSKKHLQVRRASNDILHFSAENEIVFYVKNNSKRPLEIAAKDESVRHFSVKDGDLLHSLEPKQEARFSYTIIPSKRGSFTFENIYLCYRGVFGFCEKYVKIPCPIEYKVYPNIRDLSKYRLMMQKNRLLPQGDRNIKNYGIGCEFESLRPYVDGDDYRKINWCATSRENKLIVNQYQIERNQPVYVLLDISRPMSYSVKGCKKLDYAIDAALILSDIVNQSGDKAGLMVFDSHVRSHISAGQGAGHRNQLMETLYKVEDNRSTADYGGAFRKLCEKQKRRSLVFIFTDFELPEEARELISNILLLKRNHLPIVVFMENESLNALTEIPVHKRYDKFLRKTAIEFQSERRDIFRMLSAMGVPNVESKAEDFAVAAVNRYIKLIG
jgi:uncharacterized protein (DUF58 family)